MTKSPIPTHYSHIVEIAQNSWNELFLDQEFEFVYLGGSWIHGTNLQWSDIDIFIYWQQYKERTLEEQTQYLLNIQDIMIQNSELTKVEVHFFQDLPIMIQFDIIKSGKVIFEQDPNIRQDYLEKLMPQYYDFMIWYQQHLEESVSSS